MINTYFFQIIYVLAFCGAALISYLLVKPLIKLCRRFDLLDYPEGRKSHPEPMPFMGGAAVFLSFWISIAAIFFMVYFIHQRGVYLNLLSSFLQGVPQAHVRVFWIFIGACVIWSMGFLDDKFFWTPLQKISGEVLAALILWKLGATINLAPQFGWFGDLATFAWILLMINAFNLIDSLDGHCTGVALISSITFYWITQIIHQPGVSFFVALFAGALFGFLPHNYKPAKIFLGDNGSLFIGYMLAAFTLLGRYDNPEVNYATFFVPVMAFGVPIYDTVSVAIARILKGIPPWRGDRNHFAHRLVTIGMDDKIAVTFSYFASITLGIAALLMTQVNLFGAGLVVLLYFSIIAVIAFLEFHAVDTIRRMEGTKSSEAEQDSK